MAKRLLSANLSRPIIFSSDLVVDNQVGAKMLNFTFQKLNKEQY